MFRFTPPLKTPPIQANLPRKNKDNQAAPTVSSGTITLDQNSPSFGDAVTCTVTYPNAFGGTIQGIASPQVTITAVQKGVMVFSQIVGVTNPQTSGPTTTATSAPITLGGTDTDGDDWTHGAASATASLIGYATGLNGELTLQVLAVATFEVSA